MANLQSIFIGNVIGIVLLLGLYASTGVVRGRSLAQDRVFTLSVLVCAGACIMEPLTWAVDGQPGLLARVLNVLGSTYCQLATNIFAYLWVLYVDLRLSKSERIERWYPCLLVPTALLSLGILGNHWGHLFYLVDENNVYTRMPLSYANYAMSLFSLFYSIHVRNRFSRELGTAQFFSIWLFLAPVYVGAMLQALFYGLSVAWPSVCVGITLMYLNQQNELSYIDSLTGLYNRAYLDYIMRRMQLERRGGSGIMVDLDFFKAINDTYGHNAGDEALVEVARLLVESAPKDSSVIRFAGDEFVVLLRSDDKALADYVVKRITDAVDDANASGQTPYDLSLSVGYDVFHVGEDTSDTFLRRIDDAMYDEKRSHHKAVRDDRQELGFEQAPTGDRRGIA